MGTAIANGMVAEGSYKRSSILLIEKNKKRIAYLKRKKFNVFGSLKEISKYKKDIDAVILAVKPYDIVDTLQELKEHLSKKSIVISIAAGVKLKKLSSVLGKSQPLARIMPNTPCQVGEGICAVTYNKNVSKKQKSLVETIFLSTGEVIELSENKFDLVTAISGSGPAYFCYLVENLIESGKKFGLSEKVATKLAVQTAKGTSVLIKETGGNAALLRKQVTSPKGTTEAAIKVFDKNKTNKVIVNAVKAAMDRSIELGK